jgi:nitrogen fixation-related uncharacterized protein
MDKLLTILLLANLLWACNNDQHSDNIKASDSIESDHQPNEMTEEKLSLNNGVRWKVDSTTNRNAKNLLFIVEKFNSSPEKTLTEYNQAAIDLQLGLNKMIRECKMKGSDHQALHKWLEPLIQQVTVFKQVSTKEDAVRSLEVIHTQLNLFTQFFE